MRSQKKDKLSKIRRIMAGLICVSAIGAVYAAQLPDEDGYQDMRELRKKLVRMRREMDGFMRDLMEAPPVQGPDAPLSNLADEVKADVLETDKDIVVRVDLPGMDKDKIEVTLADNRQLKIAGSRDVMKKERSPGVVRQERMVGRFERTIDLPAECMNEGIKALYNNGVLEITIPKKKGAGPDVVKVAVQ